VAEGSPTVRRRELGALLRKLREDKGLSVRQVTDHLMCSASKISRLETGERGATLRDVRDLCDLYRVGSARERNRLMTLAREAKEQGWWQSYDLPYSTYVGLEAEAVSIYGFQSSVVPGLLQTADYARTGHESVLPRLDPSVIEQGVQARLARQKMLSREQPPIFKVIMDEAVLHRAVGGPNVMSEQLKKMLAFSEMQNLTIQVIPFETGAHPAAESNFSILEMKSSTLDVVFVEGLVGSVYLEREVDLVRYNKIFNHLQEISLDPKDSATLIAKIQRKYEASLITRRAG
jgi:transcriptional regulator with XRE-family HTH domain